MPLLRVLKAVPLLPVCVLLSAADPPWKSKPVGQWDQEDAKQVLTDSPWAKSVTPQWVRDLSPDQRRDSGDMQADQGKGVGLDGLIGIFDPARAEAAIARAHAKPDPGAFLIRWESAHPVRTAEQRLSDADAPVLENDDFYAIAIYNVPTPKRWHLEGELKGIAFLKRAGRKDLKPSRVVIHRQAGDLATIVYLFPRSVEITKKDGAVTFQAQIGRLVFTRIFNTYEMQINDQLEL
jgi:hypothetical protein